jgi:peptidoglycan-N-acetylglucosamine deacetylase
MAASGTGIAADRRDAEPEMSWPGGQRVAVSLTFDVDAEAGLLGESQRHARRLTSLSEARFGVTRGLPRVIELLRGHGVQATFFVPGHTAELHPDAVAAILEAGHRSPCWELTPETFGLLVEHGFGYDSSCMGDDRPYLETCDGAEILELPVHWSLDDWPRFGWTIDDGGNVSDPAELLASWLAEFRAAREERRHVLYTMHPEVIGRACRLAMLDRLLETMAEPGDVWFASLAQVAGHVAARLRSARGP